jgi:hypothetical protein
LVVKLRDTRSMPSCGRRRSGRVAADPHSVAVVLDLVDPVGPGRRFVGAGRDVGRDVIVGKTAGWDMAATSPACPPSGVAFFELIQPLAVRRHGHCGVCGPPRPSVTCNAMSTPSGALSIGFRENQHAICGQPWSGNVSAKRWMITAREPLMTDREAWE